MRVFVCVCVCIGGVRVCPCPPAFRQVPGLSPHAPAHPHHPHASTPTHPPASHSLLPTHPCCGAAGAEFLQTLRRLCDEAGALLVFDEVQVRALAFFHFFFLFCTLSPAPRRCPPRPRSRLASAHPPSLPPSLDPPPHTRLPTPARRPLPPRRPPPHPRAGGLGTHRQAVGARALWRHTRHDDARQAAGRCVRPTPEPYTPCCCCCCCCRPTLASHTPPHPPLTPPTPHPTPPTHTLTPPPTGGLPIGAVLLTQRVADVMAPGDHGSTFAGNPLVCHAACTVFDIIAQPGGLIRGA